MKQNAIHALIVAAFLASLCLGQERGKPAISPVPLWPQDGNIPDSMKNQAVFFNPETNEIVVSVPDAAGGRKTLRFELRNQAEAVVRSQVSKLPSGLYVYEYTVGAGNNSKRPLKAWSLLIPGDDRQFNASSPAAWRVEQKATQMVDRLAVRHAPLKFIDYSVTAGAGLGKGASASGFRLVSGYLPGYVSSFARNEAKTEISPEQLATLPKAVADEVLRVTAPEWDSQMGLVVGPRFAPGTPREMIAESFHYVISSFSMRGLLDKKSDFVAPALQALGSYLKSGKGAPLSPDQLSFLSSAQTPLEREIADAMRLSLLANP